jgi:hypothetical protein
MGKAYFVGLDRQGMGSNLPAAARASERGPTGFFTNFVRFFTYSHCQTNESLVLSSIAKHISRNTHVSAAWKTLAIFTGAGQGE